MFPRLSSPALPASLSTSQRREAIASLCGYPPFRYLLEDIAEVVEVCLASLAKARTEEELVRAGRLYQATFSFYSGLSEHPQHLKEQIEAELALQPQDPFELTTLSPARIRHLQDLERANPQPT